MYSVLEQCSQHTLYSHLTIIFSMMSFFTLCIIKCFSSEKLGYKIPGDFKHVGSSKNTKKGDKVYLFSRKNDKTRGTNTELWFEIVAL